MADKEIGALTAASALTGTELVHVVQSANSRKTTAQDIANLSPAGDVVGPASVVADRISLFNGTTGKLIKEATVGISGLATAAQGTSADTAFGWGNHASGGYATSAGVAASYQPLDSDLTAIAALVATTDSFIQSKASAWVARTIAQVKTDLGLTGANSGDQTITLTGDVTGTGTGSFVATIAASAVTLAKIANIATDRILGRATAATGVVEELAALPWADTGDVTRPADSAATTIATNAVTNGKAAQMALNTIKGNNTGGTANAADLTTAQVRSLINVADGANNYVHPNHSGDVTSVADGATTIATNAVTNAKAAQMALNTLKGNNTGGTANAADLTTAQVRTLINVADGANNYVHPNHSGDVTSVADGATTIATNAVTLAKMATMATDSILGRASAATGNVEVIGALPFAYIGDVTRPADSNTQTIAASAVTYAKMQNVSVTDRLLGRSTAGAGVVEEITCTAAGRALLDDADAAAQATTLGLGTGNSPQFTGIELGHVTDTTITRFAAGVIAVEGVPLFSNIPQNSQSAAYTLVLADAQKHILHPSADTTARIWTIPANASVVFPVGTAVTFINQNAGGVITISITTDTMRLAGPGTTGSRTLAANGIATAIKITTTEWIISGTGLT